MFFFLRTSCFFARQRKASSRKQIVLEKLVILSYPKRLTIKDTRKKDGGWREIDGPAAVKERLL